MHRVVLLTDQPMFSAGMVALCEKSGTLELAGICPSLNELRKVVTELQPHLVVVDYRPEFDLAHLRDVCLAPGAFRIILIGRSIPPELACQARELGISAVLSTTMTLDDLYVGFCRILSGELVFDKRITDNLPLARAIRFTPRESELVKLLSYGLKNREISSRLGISEGTVKVYLSKLFDKVGARDRFELALFGLKSLGATLADPSVSARLDAEHVPSTDAPPLGDSECLNSDAGALLSVPGTPVFHC